MEKDCYKLYHTKSAVLFIIFNRPETTNKVFSQIKESRPAKLYIAADGPRNGVADEAKVCEETRQVVKQVDWPCEIKTLFRNANLGCKEAVSSAITWFFDQEEEGIILEDDCLPSNSFFKFCDEMLALYRSDSRVRHITGCNLQHGKKWGNASYYFSNITHVWGWAGWRRVWKDYNKELSQFNGAEVSIQLKKIFEDDWVVKKWTEIFNDVKAAKINTWDHQLGFLNFFNNSLCIIPNINLITNIGFGVKATHTFKADSINANIPNHNMSDTIIHPLYFLAEKEADFITLDNEFCITAHKKKYNKLHRKLKRWFKSKLK